MMMSRSKHVAKTKAIANVKAKSSTPKLPQLDDFVKNRDYTGAIALLEFNRRALDQENPETLLWIGYCAFHIGNYQKALDAYIDLQRLGKASSVVSLYAACCLFYLQVPPPPPLPSYPARIIYYPAALLIL
jgi:intraflagellar transport protein 56